MTALDSGKTTDAPSTPQNNSGFFDQPLDPKVFHTELRKTNDVAQRVLTKIDGPNKMTIVDSHGRSVSGTPKSGDFQDEDGARTHLNFDRSGRPTNFKVSSPDGTVSQGQLDPKTGNPKSVDITSKDGTTEHDAYDPQTGKQLTADITRTDGSVQHDQYENGFVKSSDFKYKDNSSDHWEYDAAGYTKSVERKYADGTVEHNEFNPDNGAARYSDVTTPNGMHSHYEFDPKSGTMVSHDQNMPDGTTFHEGAKPPNFNVKKGS